MKTKKVLLIEPTFSSTLSIDISHLMKQIAQSMQDDGIYDRENEGISVPVYNPAGERVGTIYTKEIKE